MGTTAAADRPSVVFVLLDCGRADRFGAWGGAHATTPALDALAAQGVRFTRHFANAHATRESMPQLMSGRYYATNILRAFEPSANPHEYPFRSPEHVPPLLPALLRAAGFHTVGASAHPWVVAESRFGAGFERLDFLAADPSRGHVDAATVVDHAVAEWRARPIDRPTFLYVHLMDLHMPRWVPRAGCRFLPARLDWARRFGEGSVPRFGAPLRQWDQSAATDFSADDRVMFAAIYDTLLAQTDAQLARLLAALRADDPSLERTVVVVTADHGEQLGEEGRIGHPASLVDGVQHVPLLLAGAGVPAGQTVSGFTEHVDVVPTVLGLLDIAGGAGDADGTALLTAEGRVAVDHRAAVHFAWLRYRAARASGHLLRLAMPGAPDALARERRETLWRMVDGERRVLGTTEDQAERESLRRSIRDRLDGRWERFARGVDGASRAGFAVPVPYWSVGDGSAITPVAASVLARGEGLARGGWMFARDSLVHLGRAPAQALDVTVAAPDGVYEAAVGVVPVGRRPLLFGRRRWRRGFLRTAPSVFLPLGRVVAADRRVTVTIPPSVGDHQRILQLRLMPPGTDTAPTPDTDSADEREHRERLRALGYVE